MSEVARACHKGGNSGEGVAGGWQKVICVLDACRRQLGDAAVGELRDVIVDVDLVQSIHPEQDAPSYSTKSWNAATQL